MSDAVSLWRSTDSTWSCCRLVPVLSLSSGGGRGGNGGAGGSTNGGTGGANYS